MTSESKKFDATMKKILSVSKAELQRRLEADKQTKIARLGNHLKAK